MPWLNTFIAALFPYRTHLEAEVAYLKGQLAQRQRRVDELQEALIAAKAPMPPQPRSEPAAPSPAKPRGWNAWRESRKEADAMTDEASA
ncbi:MAG: hypothetical protein ACLGXA_24475 [Acidobacteriota bacterium]